MSNQKDLGSGIPKVDVAQNIKNAVKNTVDMSLLMPVASRVKSRLAELKRLSSAKTVVVPQGNTKQAFTQNPEMHIANLEATIQNGEGVISYAVYKTDQNGNKLMTNHIAEVQDGIDENGSVKYKKTISSASYDFEKQVIERIKRGKPLTTEVL
jgi:energy-converting hydrogenase A subunit M